jgi:hypothetical protein
MLNSLVSDPSLPVTGTGDGNRCRDRWAWFNSRCPCSVYGCRSTGIYSHTDIGVGRSVSHDHRHCRYGNAHDDSRTRTCSKQHTLEKTDVPLVGTDLALDALSLRPTKGVAVQVLLEVAGGRSADDPLRACRVSSPLSEHSQTLPEKNTQY